MKIITNNAPRAILSSYELTPAEMAQFDYLAADDGGNVESSFFRYKGNVYDLGEFSKIDSSQRDGWEKFHGYSGDSYFSGVLVRYSSDGEAVTVARYYC